MYTSAPYKLAITHMQAAIASEWRSCWLAPHVCVHVYTQARVSVYVTTVIDLASIIIIYARLSQPCESHHKPRVYVGVGVREIDTKAFTYIVAPNCKAGRPN